MLQNKSHYNINLITHIFESLAKSIDIFSRQTLAVPHRQQKSKD